MQKKSKEKSKNNKSNKESKFSGGIAFGLDRLVMIIAGARSIREIIPFPKTQKAVSLLTQATSPVNGEQLKKLHLQFREEESPPE